MRNIDDQGGHATEGWAQWTEIVKSTWRPEPNLRPRVADLARDLGALEEAQSAGVTSKRDLGALVQAAVLASKK
jgi:hypothetical protein